MTTATMNIGHFARITAESIFEDMRPRGRQLFNHMALRCSPEKPFVWVSQKKTAEEMHCHQETVGRWMRYLESIGRAIFTGRWKFGRYKEYRLVYRREDTQSIQGFSTSSKSAGPRPTKSLDHVQQKCGTTSNETAGPITEEKQSNYHNKQQQPAALCETGKKLHALQIPKRVVVDLISQFKKEACEKQLEHLDHLQQHNQPIRNKAAWLIKAIRDDFALPNEIAEEKQVEENRRAHELNMWQQEQERALDGLYHEENYDAAIQTANRILSRCHSKTATETIKKINEERLRRQKVELAQKALSPDVTQSFFEKAKAKIVKQMSMFRSVTNVEENSLYMGMIKLEHENMMVHAWEHSLCSKD